MMVASVTASMGHGSSIQKKYHPMDIRTRSDSATCHHPSAHEH